MPLTVIIRAAVYIKLVRFELFFLTSNMIYYVFMKLQILRKVMVGSA